MTGVRICRRNGDRAEDQTGRKMFQGRPPLAGECSASTRKSRLQDLHPLRIAPSTPPLRPRQSRARVAPDNANISAQTYSLSEAGLPRVDQHPFRVRSASRR